MSNNWVDLQKSYELAALINMMKPILHEMDLEYAKVAVSRMRDSAHFHDTAAVLNPSYDPDKTRWMTVQCDALSKLIEYVELLRECDKLKATVTKNGIQRAEIAKMFL